MYEPEESEEESYSVADSGSSDRKVNDTAGKYQLVGLINAQHECARGLQWSVCLPVSPHSSASL